MPTLKDRLPSLRHIILREVQQRLNRGLAVPLFIFMECPDEERPYSLRQIAEFRNLLSHDEHHGLLVAVEFDNGMEVITKAAPHLADDLRQIPDKPVAAVVLLDRDNRTGEIVRIDVTGITGRLALRESLDAKKVDALCRLLTCYCATRLPVADSQRASQQELHAALESVLSYLLQRFPTALELDSVLTQLRVPKD